MIFSIASSLVLGSVAIYAQTKKSGGTNDAAKIQKILNNCGLKKDGESCQMLRKRKLKNDEKKVIGTEYVIRHPLGLCEDDFRHNLKRLQDGLNIQKANNMIQFSDLAQIKLNKTVFLQLKEVLKKKKGKRKEIEMEYDGTVKIRVYNEPMSRYEEYTDPKKTGWKVPIGVNRTNQIIFQNFDEEYYLLIAGSVGGGKSNAVNLITSHLLYTQPENVKLAMIDLKMGMELGCYQDCKQVIGYAEHPEQVPDVLNKVEEYIYEMSERLKKKGYRNVIEAGTKERLFLIIDEIAELSPDEESSPKAKKGEPPTAKDIKEEAWAKINHIARLGRAWGVRIVSATQHPIQECIPKYLKRNSDGRLCFSVEDEVASRVVLGSSGAESLPDVAGRAIYKKGAQTVEVQTYRIKDEIINAAIAPNIRIRTKIDPIQEVKTDESKTGGNLAETKHLNDLIKATNHTNF